jgi:uncharacterized protein
MTASGKGCNMTEIDNILTLNALHEVETSPLTTDSLQKMRDGAFHWATADAGKDGYLICFDQDADYDSPNFLWFKSRYAKFIYIDRVVVAPHARGRGLARSFYNDLITKARTAGHDFIFCEINSEPPNPGSAAFHTAIGFTEVGTAKISSKKTVSYQAFHL